MKEKTDAENAALASKLSDKTKDELREAEEIVKKVTDTKLGHDNDEIVLGAGSDKGVAGRKKQGATPLRSGVLGEATAAKAPQREESQEEHEIEVELGSILKRSPIILFSKTYCPHSRRAKDLLIHKYKIVPAPFVVELDTHPLGSRLQDALKTTTGRRTVPNVLVSGRSIGGADEVTELEANGQLMEKIRSMAGKRIMEANLRKAGD